MSTRDFLVEIGTEELPPKSLLTLVSAFADGIAKGLSAAGIRHGAIEHYATPRRLAVRVRRLAEQQPDRAIEKRGPPLKAAFDARAALEAAAKGRTSEWVIEWAGKRVGSVKRAFREAVARAERGQGLCGRSAAAGTIQFCLKAQRPHPVRDRGDLFNATPSEFSPPCRLSRRPLGLRNSFPCWSPPSYS